MFKPITSPNSYQHAHLPLQETFGVMCWNVHKETMKSGFEPFLYGLLQSYSCDLLLFQEAKLSVFQPTLLHGFSYAMSSNIQTRHHFYGVLTAAKASFEKSTHIITKTREIRFATHKSLLISRHFLADGQSVTVVNVHAINFVPQQWFARELEQLATVLKNESGAMIVAGDFNNWSNKRRNSLEYFCRSLDLTQAIMEKGHHIKQIFRQPLDHIFYRGLTLLKAEAINTGTISDHNPIYAQFIV